MTCPTAHSTPPLANRAVRLLFLAEFGAMISFYLLSATVPMYATSVGASEAGAGFTTGILMLATVLTDLLVPRLVAVFGHRALFGAGLLLLGAPSLALNEASGFPVVLLVCAVRGVGFAFVAVVGAALTASLVPKERRGEALGLYGAIGGIPAIAALPLGVWLAGNVGYGPVFVTAAVCAIAGLALLPGLPVRVAVDGVPLGLTSALRSPAIWRHAVVFAFVTMAAGATVTFLPFMVAPGATGVAALALFGQAVVSAFTRWWSGRRGDHRGAPAPLWPAVAVSAAGILIVAFSASPVVVILAMALFGAGFGMAQNASLTLMLERAAPADYDTVSTLWNLAYDAGWGVGAICVGLIAVQAGYPVAFLSTALVMLAAGHVLLRRSARTTATQSAAPIWQLE